MRRRICGLVQRELVARASSRESKGIAMTLPEKSCYQPTKSETLLTFAERRSLGFLRRFLHLQVLAK
jgi:hypothetical protein